MVVVAYTDALKPLEDRLDWVLTPVYRVANLPSEVWNWFDGGVGGRQALAARLESAEAQILLLERKAQKTAALEVENHRLRALLGSTTRLDEGVVIAEIIGLSPDPSRHWVLIDKGTDAGVEVGQPVIDAQGIAGQVVQAGPAHSRAMLISDPNHAIAVYAQRSGLRAIAVGNGRYDRLTLLHIPDTADLHPGDTLVSSGLGERFPPNYPVGTVTAVRHLPGQPFAEVQAAPSAQLAALRHLLVLIPATTPQE